MSDVTFEQCTEAFAEGTPENTLCNVSLLSFSGGFAIFENDPLTCSIFCIFVVSIPAYRKRSEWCGHFLPSVRRRARLLYADWLCHALCRFHPRQERQERALVELVGFLWRRNRLLVCRFCLCLRRRQPDKGKTFIGNTNFFLMDDTDLEQWFFQFAFACALSSIVAGTVAERCKMTAYLFYSFFLVGFVYPVVAHAFWSVNGWLANSSTSPDPLWGSGAIDLAGSGPVHMTGGVTAFVAALILGPRMGRFYHMSGPDKGLPLDEPHDFPPHSVSLQVRQITQ